MLLRTAVVTMLAGILFVAVPNWFPPRDFVEYYSAAKVSAAGGDPYDGAQLLPVQREVTGEPERKTAVSLWTPPYTLAIYAPFALFPFHTAHFVWLLAQTILLSTSVELLARRYAPHHSAWLAQLIGFGFSPFFWNLHFGQNTGFLLLGLAGFLWFRPTRPMLAGCFAALTAIKPHLLAVFGVFLLWDAWSRDGRRALFGGVCVLALGSLFALAVQPHIFDWFLEALRRPTVPETTRLADWQLPLLSYHFRHALDPNRFWMQFLPLGTACVAVIVWQWKCRIDWPSTLPWAVVLSCLVAPYGGWIFDLTVLILPVLYVFGRFVRAGRVSDVRSNPDVAHASGSERWILAILLALISWFGFRIGGLAEPIWFTPAVAVVLFYGWYRTRANP